MWGMPSTERSNGAQSDLLICGCESEVVCGVGDAEGSRNEVLVVTRFRTLSLAKLLLCKRDDDSDLQMRC
jgi:hypothetical protein